MKRIVVVFLLLAFVLAACGPAPTPVTIIITATDAPVLPTDVPAPTDAPPPTDEPEPTDEPAPTDEPVVPTDTPEPVLPTETSAPGVAPTNTKPPAVGGAVFTDILGDVTAFSLKCSPSQINFSLKSVNNAITGVTIFYRVRPKDAAVNTVQYKIGPEMVGDKKGNFTLEFSALNIEADMRATAVGWFDYQFVGTNKYGDTVGRSERFEGLISYTLECP